MKRLVLALLVLSSPTLAQAEELVLWHSYRAGEAQALDKTVDAFRAEHPEHTVRVLAVPAGPYGQKLRTAIPEGNGPDLFISAHDELGAFVRSRLIDPWQVSTERFLPETLAPLVRQDGGVWGLPLAFKSLALFYNRALVKTPPATTAELIALSQTLTHDDHFGLAYELGQPYFHAPWLFGFGGTMLSPSGDKAELDSQASVAAAQFVLALAHQHRIVPTDVNGALVTELFNRGRAAMVISGPWLVSELDPKLSYGIAPLPVVSETGQPAKPFLTVEALFVARGKQRPAVQALADALTSDASAIIRARAAHQPVANRAAYDVPELAQDPLLVPFRAQLSQSVPMPTAALMQLVWEPYAEALRQIVRGATSPERALQDAQKRLAIVSRGLPESVSPWPYLVTLIVFVLLGLRWGWQRYRDEDMGVDIKRSRPAYVFLAPAIVGMLIFVGVPLVMGVGLSFFAFSPEEVRFVGGAQFIDILTARDYPPTHPLSFYFTLVVTVLWTVSNVGLHVLLGFALALMLSSTQLWGRGVFRVLLILPWAVPSYITALIFKGLFNRQLGAINSILAALDLQPVGWFDSFVPAFCANLVTNVWLGFPFMMVTVLGALQAISPDLYEAARVDGAGVWRRFWHITLPLVLPALIPAVVLGTIWTFNMFNVVFLVSEGQPEGATDILITEAYRWAFVRNGRYGYAAAYSVIIFGILLVYGAWTRRLVSRLGQSSSA